MSRFLSLPLYESYQITAADGSVCYVTVAQATEADMAQRRAMIPKQGTPIGKREMMRKEAYLTLSSVSNVLLDGDEAFTSSEGNCGVRIRYAMTEATFNQIWNELGPELCDKIHGAVKDLNNFWYNEPSFIQHLEDLKAAVYKWYEYEDRLQQGQEAELQMEAEMLGITYSQPEPLSEYRKLERFNFTHLVHPGGLQSQPYVYMLEIKTCAELEQERERLAEQNRARRNQQPQVAL